MKTIIGIILVCHIIPFLAISVCFIIDVSKGYVYRFKYGYFIGWVFNIIFAVCGAFILLIAWCFR